MIRKAYVQQNTTQKTKDKVTWIILKDIHNSSYQEGWAYIVPHHAALVLSTGVSQDLIVITANGTHPWSFVTLVFDSY